MVLGSSLVAVTNKFAACLRYFGTRFSNGKNETKWEGTQSMLQWSSPVGKVSEYITNQVSKWVNFLSDKRIFNAKKTFLNYKIKAKTTITTGLKNELKYSPMSEGYR